MATRRQFLIASAATATTIGLSSFMPVGVSATETARFNVVQDQFVLDGLPFQILAGEMHYPRIPRELWRDRFKKLKSLGLNTLATYVFWNAHETQPGVYDFSGNLDIAAYIRMAQEEGLWVTLRPGPYVCAEWDGGGLPAWVFTTPDIPARSLDPRFMQPVTRWLKRLGQELKPLLISQGGPIILTQVENEYGSYGKDLAYRQEMHRTLEASGFDGVFYTADPADALENGSLPNVVAGINFGSWAKPEKEFAALDKFRPTGPRFCAELWGGWFDQFSDVHSVVDIPPLMDSLKWMLDRKMSISFYMLHGGTSFGFYPGANFNKKTGYQAHITSYDYDAILDEAGRPTPKYQAAKALFANYLPATAFAPLPEPELTALVPRFRLKEAASLYQLLGKPSSAAQPKTLEGLAQNHGLLLYRHKHSRAIKGNLQFGDVRDYALVSLNGNHLGTLDRRLNETALHLNNQKSGSLDILVDTHGHVNYGELLGKDQKGLLGGATLNETALNGWEHYTLPLDDIKSLRFQTTPVAGPAFYRGEFDVSAGFTFLDMRGWGKGYVWVNGYNLGRYWSAGPQHAIFVPAPYLKAGRNEVIVLDLHEGAERTLAGGKSQLWDRPGLALR
jgi:beta-galactosidase